MQYNQLDDEIYPGATARALLFELLPRHYRSWGRELIREDGNVIRIKVAIDSAEKTVNLEVNDELRAAIAHWRMTQGGK